MKATRTIRFTLDVSFRNWTGQELADSGEDDFCEPGEEGIDCLPDCYDFTPEEMAGFLGHLILDPEMQAEMFAGSGIFAKIADVKLVAHEECGL